VSASRIVEGLYVGSFPPPGNYADRFDVMVFTAEEHPPVEGMYPGVRVRYFPFDDAREPAQRDLMTAWTAGEAVARDIRRGRRVLVSCRMGRNRSALVAALAIHFVTGASGAEALELVRSRRVDDVGVRALSNQAFQRLLRSLPAA
jgi:hypothetical protein